MMTTGPFDDSSDIRFTNIRFGTKYLPAMQMAALRACVKMCFTMYWKTKCTYRLKMSQML